MHRGRSHVQAACAVICLAWILEPQAASHQATSSPKYPVAHVSGQQKQPLMYCVHAARGALNTAELLCKSVCSYLCNLHSTGCI